MKESELRLLTENGAPLDVQVARQDSGGFVVTVNGKPMSSARQGVRPFAKLDTVASVLGAAGVRSFTVVLGGAAAVSKRQMRLPEV